MNRKNCNMYDISNYFTYEDDVILDFLSRNSANYLKVCNMGRDVYSLPRPLFKQRNVTTKEDILFALTKM